MDEELRFLEELKWTKEDIDGFVKRARDQSVTFMELGAWIYKTHLGMHGITNVQFEGEDSSEMMQLLVGNSPARIACRMREKTWQKEMEFEWKLGTGEITEDLTFCMHWPKRWQKTTLRFWDLFPFSDGLVTNLFFALRALPRDVYAILYFRQDTTDIRCYIVDNTAATQGISSDAGTGETLVTITCDKLADDAHFFKIAVLFHPLFP